MKNVLYFNSDSEVVKFSQHVNFDEVMNNVNAKSLNAHLLHGLDPGSPDVLDLTLSVLNLDVSAQPFTDLATFVIPFDPDSLSPLGLHFDLCSQLQCLC